MKASKGQTSFKFPSRMGKVTAICWIGKQKVSFLLCQVAQEDFEAIKAGVVDLRSPSYWHQFPSRVEVWPPCPTSGNLVIVYQPPENRV